MQKISYRVLAESRGEFENILTLLHLKIEQNTWLYRAYNIVEKLADVYQDVAIKREFMKQENEDGDIYYALHDVSLINGILLYTKDQDRSTLKGKFKKVLRMDSPPRETLYNNEARNALWELNFFSRLKRANIEVILSNPNPDILARFGHRKYYIQCKRLYSANENALIRNIREAIQQLKKDLSTEGNDAFGMLAFSLERPVTEGRLMLVTNSEQTGREKLSTGLQEFISQYGYLWQNPNLIGDPRIVAIILHYVVPGIVEEENIFVTASQVIINNTWANGNGFQSVIEDFGPLKDAFEQ